MQAEVPSHQIFAAQAVSGTTTYYSGTKLDKAPAAGNNTGTDANGSLSVSIVGQLTGTPGGTITVEVSNSSDEDIRKALDVWVTEDTVTLSGWTAGVATVTAGLINGSASFAMRLMMRFRRVRLKYVNGSGSGTISATITVKR